MTPEEDPQIRAAIESLTACGALKTWSLIVTILGDLAGHPGDRISGPALHALCGRLGVQPAALRVALHRLRRDGWISADRAGRTGMYGLSDHGLAQTRAVAHRVYDAHPPDPAAGWSLVVAPSAAALEALALQSAIVLGRQAAVVPHPPEKGIDMLHTPLRQGTLPLWVRELATPPELSAAYVRFSATLTALTALLDRLPNPPSLLDSAILRLLAVHNWRRLVLRDGPGPEALLGADWPGSICRRQMAALLLRLERPCLHALESAVQAT